MLKMIRKVVLRIVLIYVCIQFGFFLFQLVRTGFKFSSFEQCIPESVLVSTDYHRIHLIPTERSQTYSSFDIEADEHFLCLTEYDSGCEKYERLPAGTELRLDGFARHIQPLGFERSFSSSGYIFRGAIGDKTVWISDFYLDGFEDSVKQNPIQHKANSQVLRSLGFVDFENEYIKRLEMPDDWTCL